MVVQSRKGLPLLQWRFFARVLSREVEERVRYWWRLFHLAVSVAKPILNALAHEVKTS